MAVGNERLRMGVVVVEAKVHLVIEEANPGICFFAADQNDTVAFDGVSCVEARELEAERGCQRSKRKNLLCGMEVAHGNQIMAEDPVQIINSIRAEVQRLR